MSKGYLTQTKVVLSMVKSTLTTDSGVYKAKLQCVLLKQYELKMRAKKRPNFIISDVLV